MNGIMPRIITFIFAVLCLLSCGLEDYSYLPPVPQSSIRMTDNTRATINIPGSYSSYSNFYTFKIYYRIYISGYQTVGEINTTTEMNSINRTLTSDYNAIYPSTDTTSTTANTSIESLFRNRRYYELSLTGTGINNFLASSVGRTVTLNFTGNETPNMEISGTSYLLNRSTGDGVFKPEPDLYFRNTQDLYDSDKANTDQNADVANVNSTETVPASPRYTYISFYIVAAGFNQNNLTTFYSSPTFIGILRLPEPIY